MSALKSAVLTLLLAAGLSSQAGQVCDGVAGHALSSPTSRFEDHGDGTVTDRESRLMWLHCSAGQAWSAATGCTGEVERHTWASALRLADELNLDGRYAYSDWRLPQLRELATIAERRCANPRINLAVFPGTPAARYWSASARPDGGAPQALSLSFGADGVAWRSKDEANPVRLVRSAR